jgi:hypothetical protein
VSESRAATSTGEKQSLVHARSATGLALILLVAAVVLRVAFGWNPAVLLGIAAFFGVVAGVELLNVRHLRGREMGREKDDAVGDAPPPGEIGTFRWRGEECYGLVVATGDRRVALDIARDARLEQRADVLRDLATMPERLFEAFNRFKAHEAASRSDYTEQILALEPELISFREEDPAKGEVTFTVESGGEYWFCGYESGRFVDLVMESWRASC